MMSPNVLDPNIEPWMPSILLQLPLVAQKLVWLPNLTVTSVTCHILALTFGSLQGESNQG